MRQLQVGYILQRAVLSAVIESARFYLEVSNVAIEQWVGARVGVIGNPSDGFGGKTIACLIRNFGASVTLRESRTIEIVRHPLFDPLSFSDLAHLYETAAHDGYYGGMRLLFATCKRFYQYCRDHGISLPDRSFVLQYDTNIPRQVGLGGSSAIITAAVKAMMKFYELDEEDIPKPEQPNLVLSVETEELGITAGLQDRVVQVYGGLVYMDFNNKYMAADGHGYYQNMDVDCLPPMYLAYSSAPSDSGQIHNIVSHRLRGGDPEVLDAVRTWGAYTDAVRRALLEGDHRLLAALMNLNFDLRRKVYGDEYIGAHNLEMVETARKLALPAKFSGSGGAVLGTYEDEQQFQQARQAFTGLGYSFIRLMPATYEDDIVASESAGTGKTELQPSAVL